MVKIRFKIPLEFCLILIVGSCLSGCAPSITSSNGQSRLEALSFLNSPSDQAILAKIAIEDDIWVVAEAALKKLTDQTLIFKVAVEAKISWVSETAVKMLTDQAQIAKIAIEGKNENIRVTAANELENQAILAKISIETPDIRVRCVTIGKLTDQELLAKIVKEEKDSAVRRAAITAMTDQAILSKVAMENNGKWDTRKLAFSKLDNEHLNMLAAKSTDDAIRLAALVRLKLKTWDEIFEPSQISSYKLGDVLGAVALVDKPSPTSASVVAACHTYIKQGDESRIPELRDLLIRFGDKSLAEDYLNCGHAALHTAAEEWGRSHGYSINTGSGSHRVRWGESR
ncbi:hypothetical protein OR1_03975 [Geobacter sp. OR-1]|uniref:hypothetical protein n=1 Tax=Geobacter sp. OR-1 TaxID=1266765 RepID=UPI0005443351|nr:hypothetical protein [Geobacter sp. OR-1]GAM11659.1 hypothetical protein OR1_03975 [Geobacter sp. OR-1]